MLTQSQIDANRRNAQHFTGPRSAEGKAASSMNALNTGIHAESSVVPGEDPSLTERFYQDCQSQSVIESVLVDNIIRHTWLLRRFDRINAQLLIYKIEDTNLPQPQPPSENCRASRPNIPRLSPSRPPRNRLKMELLISQLASFRQLMFQVWRQSPQGRQAATRVPFLIT